MAKVEIKAKDREIARKRNKKLREEGLVPAVIYGRKFKTVPVSVDLLEFKKKVLRSEAGRNLIFTLKLAKDDKPQSVPVITQAIQIDPLTDEIIHLDFMHIIMDEAIKAKVPIELVGNPVGVKEGGVLIHGLRAVEIKCLPGDIPDKFEIDVSALNIGDSLHVSDLKIAKKVEVLAPATEMIANVSPPTKEEEVAPPVPTPEELAAAEAAPAVAEEEVKEKSPPGAAPAKPAAGKPEKPAPEAKK